MGSPPPIRVVAMPDRTLRSESAGRWLEVQDVDAIGLVIEPGFSGAPAFGSATGEILGMVVAASPEKEERRAFVLPNRLLLEAWPLLARPYRGLQAFTEEDSEFFFGRERYVAEITARLQSRPIVPIIGPSGSGKSSILLAGVMPRLKATGTWRVAVFRPGRDPVANLFDELVSLLEPQATTALKRLKAMNEARELVGENIAGLVEAARAICRTERVECLLLVVDQFEELFTLSDPVSAQQFIERFFVDPPVGARCAVRSRFAPTSWARCRTGQISSVLSATRSRSGDERSRADGGDRASGPHARCRARAGVDVAYL
jgi:hypothetical protein